MLRRERSISGDVLLTGGDKFQLVARADDAGPWMVEPQQLSLGGLKIASCELAEQILGTTDRNLLAAALIRRGDYKRVINLYDVMPTDKDKRADALNNLAVALLHTGETDDAITKFHQALGLKTTFSEPHYNLGVALFDKGNIDGAIEEYRKSLSLETEQRESTQ